MVLCCIPIERFERREASRRSDVVQRKIAGIAEEPAVGQVRKDVPFEGTGGEVGNGVNRVSLNGIDAGIQKRSGLFFLKRTDSSERIHRHASGVGAPIRWHDCHRRDGATVVMCRQEGAEVDPAQGISVQYEDGRCCEHCSAGP